MTLYLKLFWEFFKTGLFAVGGGMATVPFLQDMGRTTGWFTSAELADMIAVSESTPGPIGVNMATYVGNVIGRQAGGSAVCGVFGGIIATLGLVAPSVIIILIIAGILKKFRDSKYVSAAFYGLRPASVALISAAGFAIILIAFFGVEKISDFRTSGGISFGTSGGVSGGIVPDWRYFALAAVLILLTRFIPATKKLHPIIFILFSAVVGVVFAF
ncbi:MAG: chromate transporter [Lachnospiraceae bacterium]|nr:chromate transporter [Lachnospiraceae bacterium]